MDTEPSSEKQRIPPIVNGIQVNFCKNPLCLNFGRPASLEEQPRGKNAALRGKDSYKIIGDSWRRTFLSCDRCGETPPLKSNLAISEETNRFLSYLTPKHEPTCPSDICSNNAVGISTPKAYYSFGKTKSGSQRYRCRKCSTTFAVGIATLRQKRPEVNELVFKLLVNKMPMNRIMETAAISASTLYSKINFIHRQCLEFAAIHEKQFSEMPVKRLYLSVDRQDHMINWKEAGDKRNAVLSAAGCADNKTSYVFGIHVNYDATLDAKTIEADADKIGDTSLRHPFRRYARVWLEKDYSDALANSVKRKAKRNQLFDSIQEAYNNSIGRDDVENPDIQALDTALPYKGMQVHSDYTLYAHFFFLHSLFKNVEKVRFFLDQDSGIRAACLSAFFQEVLEKRCDAFYVRINKDLTINQKRRLKAASIKELNDYRSSSASYADIKDGYLRHIIIKDRLSDLVDIGDYHDRWLFYPFPDMSEPEKAICWLTDLNDHSYDQDHLASLYSKATLHGIDRFFMQVRRRLSLLERPISSASSDGRKWYGYSPYNPAMVGKLLDIFRVFYNYIEVGKDKSTPAMRLGLTSAPTQLNDIFK